MLAERIAWRSLGAVGKTPVHICRIPSLTTNSDNHKSQQQQQQHQQQQLKFYLKREDLISPLYGGNKVRTLQHQLAVCESRRERGERAFRNLVSVGTGGSNQVVATVVHARGCGWDAANDYGDENGDDKEKEPRIHVFWPMSDAPDFDNTLNLLSVLSFSNITGFQYSWGDKIGKASNIRHALHGAWTQRDFIPMMLGGNCPAGVLGQISGILELAEQIDAGESVDPQRIYVPVGSGCTIAGLIIGTVLVRHFGLSNALNHAEFKIVGCNVHEMFAQLDRVVNFHLHPFFSFLPLTISHSVKATCHALKELGGPDILEKVLEFIKTSVELRCDADVVGMYGAHSEQTRNAAKLYDEKGVVTADGSEKDMEKLWLCGHFTSKAFQPLIFDLEAEITEKMSNNNNKTNNKEIGPPKFMLWMTKSAVQPRGNADEWIQMMHENDTVKQWADEGKAESILRPGRVSTMDGTPDDYRFLMKKIV